MTGDDLADLLAKISALPLETQTQLFAGAIKTNTLLVTDVLFPILDGAARRRTAEQLQRLVEQQHAKEAFEQLRASQVKAQSLTSLAGVAEMLEDGTYTAPEPTIGGLLYPGRVNALYGTHTAGKTWTALHLARCNAEAGDETLLIDYEDSEVGLAARCLALDPKLAKSVHYLAPAGALRPEDFAEDLRYHRITLVIIDSVGESMAACGYDSNSEQDVTRWFTEVPDAFAEMGPAVLVLDHIAKKQDGTPSPVGSFRKSAAITGAQFALENGSGFSKERAGWSKLTCTKDRNGHFATGEAVGRMDFIPIDGVLTVALVRGAAAAQKVSLADSLEQAVMEFIEDRMATVHGQLDENDREMDGRPSITQIRDAVRKGGVPASNSKVREAVDRLVANGHLAKVHNKSGQSTRDVFVPSFGGLEEIDPEEA